MARTDPHAQAKMAQREANKKAGRAKAAATVAAKKAARAKAAATVAAKKAARLQGARADSAGPAGAEGAAPLLDPTAEQAPRTPCTPDSF